MHDEKEKALKDSLLKKSFLESCKQQYLFMAATAFYLAPINEAAGTVFTFLAWLRPTPQSVRDTRVFVSFIDWVMPMVNSVQRRNALPSSLRGFRAHRSGERLIITRLLSQRQAVTPGDGEFHTNIRQNLGRRRVEGMEGWLRRVTKAAEQITDGQYRHLSPEERRRHEEALQEVWGFFAWPPIPRLRGYRGKGI
ncbi:hypothetical protein BJY01DRAFT_254969 [Aspergillus pseudoustus]|uniref:Uncharacterized protein n=1 Tax=Aspergillus pseudoustus TaxID=1810923 RepID=A0ABR4IPS1_9EURO